MFAALEADRQTQDRREPSARSHENGGPQPHANRPMLFWMGRSRKERQADSMGSPTYLIPGLVLQPNSNFSVQVQALQRDLRSLGYHAGPLDGVFGPGTTKAIMALQYDLMNNAGASTSAPGEGAAPVSVMSYNNGAVTGLTGILDQPLAGCIAAMLADNTFSQVSSSANAATDNQAALAAIAAINPPQVPVPFLMEVLNQESGQRQFHVPSANNPDNFVTIGLDHNNAGVPAAITSRGYGIGQYTLFHHPPTQAETGVIQDPVQNANAAIQELLGKFNNYVIGPTDSSSDRIAEIGNGPLRVCQYQAGDPKYLRDCANCCTAAGTANIVAGVTPVFAGSAMTYAQTQYHVGTYNNVPIRAKFLCDWPYAIRRYNGAGPNSYDYQAEVLLRIAGEA